jgi:hypothetical protein
MMLRLRMNASFLLDNSIIMMKTMTLFSLYSNPLKTNTENEFQQGVQE